MATSLTEPEWADSPQSDIEMEEGEPDPNGWPVSGSQEGKLPDELCELERSVWKLTTALHLFRGGTLSRSVSLTAFSEQALAFLESYPHDFLRQLSDSLKEIVEMPSGKQRKARPTTGIDLALLSRKTG